MAQNAVKMAKLWTILLVFDLLLLPDATVGFDSHVEPTLRLLFNITGHRI